MHPNGRLSRRSRAEGLLYVDRHERGNGLGKDEVRSFEVFLNGKSIVTSGNSPNAQVTVAVQMSNRIKVILTGEPSSKVLVLIAYDPRQ
jgi:hypothetical protein